MGGSSGGIGSSFHLVKDPLLFTSVLLEFLGSFTFQIKISEIKQVYVHRGPLNLSKKSQRYWHPVILFLPREMDGEKGSETEYSDAMESSGDDENSILNGTLTSDNPKKVFPIFSTPVNGTRTDKKSENGKTTKKRRRKDEGGSSVVIDVEEMSDRKLLEEAVSSIRSLNVRVNNLENVIAEFADVKTQVEDLRNEIKKLPELEKKLKASEYKVEVLEKSIEGIMRSAKSNNVILKGINPEQNTHPTTCAQQFFTRHLNANSDMFRINSAKYIYGRNGSTSVIATLGAPNDKSYLFSLAHNLKGTKFTLSDDLTPQQMVIRNILLRKRREIIDNGIGKVVKLYDKALKVDNEWYDLLDNGDLVIRPSLQRKRQ